MQIEDGKLAKESGLKCKFISGLLKSPIEGRVVEQV